MADPRNFTVKSCPVDVQRKSIQAGRKKGFLDNLTKIGDLEILNDIGFGKVGEGLRVLSAVSDSIRVGTSIVPGREGDDTYNSTLGKIVGTAVDAVEEGAQTVLETVGLDKAADLVSDFNPAVANRAYGQAKQIYQKVKSGNFALSDIPHVFSDLQNLETLSRGIFGGDKQAASKPRKEMCDATPYARDLIAFAPKFKFLFIVEVQLAPAYQDWGDIVSQMAFVVKTSSRPRFEVEYEDVNMYNFRTRVAKRVIYPAINMTFYDDNKNGAHSFYTAYMRAMSPIANIKQTIPQTDDYEQNSMNFSKSPAAATFGEQSPPTAGYSASLGPLADNMKSIISSIKLYHVYDYGNAMNVYNFYNPRITNFNPSELSQMETGEGTDFEIEFEYDGLYIENGYNLVIDQGKLLEITWRHGQRPIDPEYGDEQADDVSSQSTTPPAQQQEEMASTFLGGITKSISSITDNISGELSGIVGSITDNVSGELSGIVGSITDNVTSITKGVNSTLSSINSGINQAFDAAKDLGSQGLNALSQLTAAGKPVSNAFKENKKFKGSFFI